MTNTTWSQAKFGELFLEPSRNGVYKKKGFHGRGQQIVNMGELFAFDFISNQNMKRVELDSDELEKDLLRNGDLLFARRSLLLAGSGKCSITKDLAEDTTFESSIIRVRLDSKIADPLFFYYFFKSPPGRGVMASIASQTAVSGITSSNLAQLDVPLPSKEIQVAIASFLSNYDALIENNIRRIQILEGAAQALYTEWFINFRFPGREKVNTVDSRTEFGKVPEKWKVLSLREIAAVNASSIVKGKEPKEILYVDIASVKEGTIAHKEPMKFESAPGRARRIVAHGDIIWSSVRPNRRSFALVLQPEQNPHRLNGVCDCIAKSVPYSYLYQTIITDSFVGYLVGRATGSAYPAVTAEDFEEAKLLCPTNDVLTQFNEIAEPLLLCAENLKRQNLNLRNRRDLLIPKLVTGEISV